jgi:hypothetical protein
MGVHWLAASSSARAGSGAVGIKEATMHTAAIHTHVLGKCHTKTSIGAVSGTALENFQALSEAALKTYRSRQAVGKLDM